MGGSCRLVVLESAGGELIMNTASIENEQFNELNYCICLIYRYLDNWHFIGTGDTTPSI